MLTYIYTRVRPHAMHHLAHRARDDVRAYEPRMRVLMRATRELLRGGLGG